MNSAFNDQILAEKLKKLNNSQQSIETLSHWCIFHRKKAHLVVETWDKQLRVLPKEQRVPFLYLANDILQNSRRRGGEFVTEFWKVLPGALKDVIEKGDDQAQSVVVRLVDIWDERKVFGIRAKTLREELLGTDPPTDLSEQHVKLNQNAKLKVAVSGSIQEKLISAYRSVQNAASEEDATLGRCNAAVIRIEGLEKEADELQDKSILADELQDQEEIVSHCIGQLETSESARTAVISLLKEALREQESKLELIRSRIQSAKSQAHHSSILRQKFLAHSTPASVEAVQQVTPTENKLDSKLGSFTSLAASDTYQWPPLPPTEEMTSFVDEFKNPPSLATSAAAEVAAKLAASSSSAQVLASVLSSMVAEEASNIRTANAPLEAPSSTTFSEKRQRVDEEMEYVRSSENSSAYVHQPAPPPPTLQNTNPQYYSGSVQLYSSSPQQAQPHYPPLPPGPPQSTNVNTQAFGYAGMLPRPPPHPPMQGQLPMSNPHMFNSGTYPAMRPPGMGFFDQQSLPAAHLPRH
eukprot:c23011_g1_i1 orf=659-2227(-)